MRDWINSFLLLSSIDFMWEIVSLLGCDSTLLSFETFLPLCERKGFPE
jgi:hypothetical protein